MDRRAVLLIGVGPRRGLDYLSPMARITSTTTTISTMTSSPPPMTMPTASLRHGRSHGTFATAVLSVWGCHWAQGRSLPVPDRYPEIEPYDHGLLDAGYGNLVYWETCGNPGGKQALVLHGGPGSGCHPSMRRYFDPATYRIVLFTSCLTTAYCRTRLAYSGAFPVCVSRGTSTWSTCSGAYRRRRPWRQRVAECSHRGRHGQIRAVLESLTR